jgi:hypothetical protein
MVGDAKISSMERHLLKLVQAFEKECQSPWLSHDFKMLFTLVSLWNASGTPVDWFEALSWPEIQFSHWDSLLFWFFISLLRSHAVCHHLKSSAVCVCITAPSRLTQAFITLNGRHSCVRPTITEYFSVSVFLRANILLYAYSSTVLGTHTGTFLQGCV